MGILSAADGCIGRFDQWYFSYYWKRHSGHPALFHKGWGSQAAIDAVNAQWRAGRQPDEVDIQWAGPWLVERGVWVRRGWFETPELSVHLPSESLRAYVHFIRPALEDRGPVALLLPTSREAGVESRMPIARALARSGISSMLLESPYMGRRKPHYQYDTTLTYLSDFLLLCAACIAEGRALLGWLGRQGFSRLSTAGISKGGYLAVATGLRAPVKTNVVALVPPHSGAPVLLDGLIGGMCDWNQLQRTSGSETPVRQQVAHLFSLTSLEQLPGPTRGQQLILIGARNDRYVPPRSLQLMQSLWQHASVRWLAGGHVSSIAERRHVIDAVVEVLAEPGSGPEAAALKASPLFAI